MGELKATGWYLRQDKHNVKRKNYRYIKKSITFADMNKIESFVYHKVKNNYILKNLLRNVYQGFYDLMPRRASWTKIAPLVREGFFYGFHDTTPFSADDKKVLCNHLLIPLRMPTANDVLEVGYFTGEEFDRWVKVGETTAWNYHKGCRLQWVSDHRCIFNTGEGGRLGATICDIEDGSTKKIAWAIDTVSHDGRWATSFSYERLEMNMPGYGYAIGDGEAYAEELKSGHTGLFLIDLEKGSRQLLLSLQQIAAFEPQEGMDNDTMHFVTHTEFSHSDRYVDFLHRWYKGTYRRTRLLIYDRETGQLHASPTTGMVSHYAWNGQDGLVAYCRVEDVDSHVFFTDATMREWKRCGYPRLNSDGHHHFVNDHCFVVDTYPDRHRHARLYLVDTETDAVEMVADVESGKHFVSPDEHHHWKCDLHPRCSHNGHWLCFDSVHTGKRALCLMKQ